MTPSDSPRPGEDNENEKDRDPPSQTPAQTPVEPLPEEDLDQVEEQPS